MICMDEDTGICLLTVARCHARSIVVGLITPKAAVLITSKLCSLRDWTLAARYSKSSFLLSSSLRNDFQFKGMAALSHTRLRVPVPLAYGYLVWGCSLLSNDPTPNRFFLHSECDSWWGTGENCFCVPLKGLALTRWKHVNNSGAIKNNWINRRTLKRFVDFNACDIRPYKVRFMSSTHLLITRKGRRTWTVFVLEKFLEVSFSCLTEIRSCFFLRSYPQVVLLHSKFNNSR